MSIYLMCTCGSTEHEAWRREVGTCNQSGNVVFKSPGRGKAAVLKRIRARLRRLARRAAAVVRILTGPNPGP